MTDVSAWELLAERFVISEEEASFSRPLSLPLEAASYSGVFMEGGNPISQYYSGFWFSLCLPAKDLSSGCTCTTPQRQTI